MTDIFKRIKQDHDEARELMQQIKDTTSSGRSSAMAALTAA